MINRKHNKQEIINKMPSIIMSQRWTNKLIDHIEGHIDHLEMYVYGALRPPHNP